jgi:hypothetical protein
MPELRFQFDGDAIGRRFNRAIRQQADRVKQALKGTAEDAKQEILKKGRADIASAGNFGSRWTDGLHVEVKQDDASGDATIDVSHDVPYFLVHEKGALIRGKPLLAIPMSFAPDAKGVLARNYPGGLFRVDRKAGGAPLLLSRRTGEVKYFLRQQVRIPKRFHLLEIIRDVAKRMREFYFSRINK